MNLVDARKELLIREWGDTPDVRFILDAVEEKWDEEYEEVKS